MPDVVDVATRSRMMAGIRGRDTKPEMVVRRALHRAGFRFRVHSPIVPGKPDLVLSRYRVAIFVHGCFWHGHDCKYFKWPGTRRKFWREKILANRDRDTRVEKMLQSESWRRVVIWECAIRGRSPQDLSHVLVKLSDWIRNSRSKRRTFRSPRRH